MSAGLRYNTQIRGGIAYIKEINLAPPTPVDRLIQRLWANPARFPFFRVNPNIKQQHRATEIASPSIEKREDVAANKFPECRVVAL